MLTPDEKRASKWIRDTLRASLYIGLIMAAFYGIVLLATLIGNALQNMFIP